MIAPTTRLLTLPCAALAAGFALVCLGACGDKAEPTPPPSQAPTAEPTEPPAPPAPSVVLPPTGEITTGALSPSTPDIRLPSEAEKQAAAQQQQAALGQLMDGLRQRQAAGLDGATVTVNAAWPYQGYSTLAPDPAAGIPARLVAVDLTVEGHTADFDPDDIEIVDGVTLVSYGSDPHLTLIKGPGQVLAEGDAIPAAPAPLRMLLIYAFPKATRTFTLYYWGKALLAAPRPFDAEGWGLPYPEKPETER